MWTPEKQPYQRPCCTAPGPSAAWAGWTIRTPFWIPTPWSASGASPSFSKQAVLELGETRVTLLDTPGHVDFSAEMERTLQVLDCAVLVISGTDGVQGHTRTLWDLLERYQVPTFLFINKMDLAGADRAALLAHLKNKLSGGCVDFGDPDTLWEEAAVCDEAALEQYLETGELPEDMISRLIGERKLFPCYFGSALKVEGVEELLCRRGAVCPPAGLSGRIRRQGL